MMKVLLTFLLFLLPFAKAEITVCSEAGNSTCAGTNQVCLLDTTAQTENCGHCLGGYFDITVVDDGQGCRDINEIPFEEYVEKHKPLYVDEDGEDEEAKRTERLGRLRKVLQYVSQWNSRIPPPAHFMGVNKFSGDTESDRKKLLGAIGILHEKDSFPSWEGASQRRLQDGLPPRKDWVEEGAVTTVKDQGRCACCWTISNCGAIEGAAFINGLPLKDLSFQQLISCDDSETKGLNNGCSGGNILLAMYYSWKNALGGLVSLEDYPFTDAQGVATEECALDEEDKERLAVAINSPRAVVTYKDEDTFEERRDKFKAAVAQQPVSIALKTECDLFISYAGGIMTTDEDCACEDVSCVDHAVLLVGYDDTTDPPSWKVKNSWSDAWGEDGYFRISQEGGGKFGLFGMLGEGAVTLEASDDAYNTTEAKPEGTPEEPRASTTSSGAVTTSRSPRKMMSLIASALGGGAFGLSLLS